MGLLTDVMTGNSGINKVVSAFKNRGKGKSSGGGSANTDDPGAPSYHSGGKVRKTGLARLKKGERVLTKGQQRKLGVMRGRGRKR